jgi:hypothetical protein
VGASGGLITLWNDNRFNGGKIFENDYALSIQFCSLHSGASWILTNIYGPCSSRGKFDFLNWLKGVDTPDDTDWLIIGDFNLIRASSNRNKPGANMQEIFAFNEAISSLGLVELPLKGMKYTWSNMQPPDPLLVKLDCFFTSSSWTCNYPGTYVSTLSGIFQTMFHVWST